MLVIERDFAVSMMSRPPSGMASRALMHEVHDDLLDLGGIGADDERENCGVRLVLISILLPMTFSKRLMSFGDVLIEIDVAGLQNLAAGEGEELAGERGGANGLMANFIEVAMEASFGVGLVHAEFGPAENGADHVVKIVSDAAGQLADGFEFLGLTDLFFQREAFGNFFDDDLGAIGLAAGSRARRPMRRTVMTLPSQRFQSTLRSVRSAAPSEAKTWPRSLGSQNKTPVSPMASKDSMES